MANLPADLPEDWTQGQTISPNGTEVGLSEQHGYNYLMEQVNATQTEVNAINTSLEDVAQETSVQQVITTIGTTTDSGGSSTEGSLMAKLNEILSQLGISTTGSTVQEVLEELLTQPKVVKHIQRGVLPGNIQSQISIGLDGFTNENKMIAFVNMCDDIAAWRPTAFSLTTTQLLIQGSGGQRSWGFYQIIEFC